MERARRREKEGKREEEGGRRVEGGGGWEEGGGCEWEDSQALIVALSLEVSQTSPSFSPALSASRPQTPSPGSP